MMTAALLLLAAACAGGGAGDDTGSPSSSTIGTTSSTDAGTGASATVTPPGTQLTFGQAAFVPLQVQGVRGVIAVAVVSVTAGLPQDRTVLRLANGNPYYVTMMIQNTGSPPDLGSYEPDLVGVQSDGIQASAVNEPDDFPPCEDHGPTALALGASFVTCEAYVAAAGTTMAAVEFIPGPGIDPITWKPA